jgi:1-acyl-sn-glycerol-3-phosphate acyltransferase
MEMRNGDNPQINLLCNMASNTSSPKGKVYRMLELWKIPTSFEQLPYEHHVAASYELSEKAGPEGFPKGAAGLARPKCPISPWEEFICVLIFLIVPGSPLVILGTLVTLYLLNAKSLFTLFIVFCIACAVWPVKFWPEILSSKYSALILKYFSFRGIWVDQKHPLPDKQYILVAPPHGAFPLGNLCTILAAPRIMKKRIRGLAASAVFHLPGFRQLLTWAGCISASRDVALKELMRGESLGVSSGGIAEIFETNGQHETIILKNRFGLAKLALRTGAALVPCFVFGNSEALSLWYDNRGILQFLSRKFRVSLFFFWGRWGLPIPYRTSITGVMGEPMEVQKKENPTDDEVMELHFRFMKAMKELFDTHKTAYGWPHRDLIIK